MLRKLLKYEFLATARVFGVCYLGLAALSILAGLSMKFPATSNNIVGGILLMAYVCMLAAVMLFTFLTIIRRFYKNLLGGEGYLMNTLPVRSWQLVTSKLIASMVCRQPDDGRSFLCPFDHCGGPHLLPLLERPCNGLGWTYLSARLF